MAMVLCIFCWQERPLTVEHLISKPISNALGIDRSSSIGEFAPSTEGPGAEGVRFVALGDLKVRSACRECNNGWMATLEEAAAESFRSWLKHGRLPPGDEDALRRCSQFDSSSGRSAMEVSGPSRIGSNRENLLRFLTSIGHADSPPAHLTPSTVSLLAPPKATGNPMYGSETPRRSPKAKGQPFTAVLALHLPPVQLWVADAVLECEIRLPTGVRALKPGLALRRLRARGSNLLPDQALVTFPFRDR